LNVQEAIDAGKAHAINVLENEFPDLDEEIEKPKCISGRKNPAEVFFIKQSIKE